MQNDAFVDISDLCCSFATLKITESHPWQILSKRAMNLRCEAETQRPGKHIATKDAQKASKDIKEHCPRRKWRGKESSTNAGWNIERENENRWDCFFPSMSVTLPWESKATGEPDFAELRISVSPLHQDIYYLNSSTGNFPAKILISADVCFSSACILITGGSLWSEAPLQLHNFPSNHFSSGLLISFWHSSFFL